MAQHFKNPYPQFLSSTPEVRSGAQLFFYEAGSSTKLNTYPSAADEAADTNANANPVILNSSGYPDVLIFMKNQAYKVVLAPSTDSDPPSSPIWTADNYWATDFSSVMETKVGSGSPTGNVSGTAASAGVLPTQYWDYTNEVLYVCTTTGNAASAQWTALNASASTPSVPAPQGRLTLASGTPILASDQVSKTTVYYTPYIGNLIPIYNGSSFTPTQFSELNLSLVSQHALDTIYDIFVWSESGVLTVGTGPAWNTSTAGSGARGTGASTTELTRIDGILVNAVAMTTRNSSTTYSVGANLATYVGSILIDGTAGQATCHVSYGQSRKFGIWNAYNRRPIILKAGDSTASWTYNSTTTRQSRADTGNTIAVFAGLAEEYVDLSFDQAMHQSGNISTVVGVGIGKNSTTTQSGLGLNELYNGSSDPNPNRTVYTASYIDAPTLGLNNFNCLEKSFGSNTQTFYGTEANMLMLAKYMG